MDMITPSRSEPRPQLPGVPRKSLDNPLPQKPTYRTDAECAVLLEAILRQVPTRLEEIRASPFPLLAAFTRISSEAARELIFVSAATHQSADERRTAEYLLRNRHVLAGRRTALSLLRAARCAAEMDLRRVRVLELPTPHEAVLARRGIAVGTRLDDPSVGEVVVERLRAATGEACRPVTIDRILDATAIAFDLARRHTLKGGTGPSVLAMRSKVRRDARLVTHLRAEFANDTGARSVSRLLVGADGTCIENALLWWAARPLSTHPAPHAVSIRWRRYLRIADIAFGASAESAASACAQALSTAAA